MGVGEVPVEEDGKRDRWALLRAGTHEADIDDDMRCRALAAIDALNTEEDPLSNMPSDEWIQATDDRLSAADVAVRARPLKALLAWWETHGPSAFSSPEASAIFDWYEKSYPPDSFIIGSLFEGVFFFDQALWPVHIPVGFGTFQVTINKMVANMTKMIGDRLSRNGQALSELTALAADCLDYGYGFDELRNEPLASPLARDMLTSGHKELQGAVHVLLSKRPSEKVAESAALATEMFFKSYLAQHAGLDKKSGKKIGHDLAEGLRQCLAHDSSSDLRMLQGRLGSLPQVAGARYKPRAYSLKELWYAYSLAQFAGACVIRSMTDRDCRASLRATTGTDHDAT